MIYLYLLIALTTTFLLTFLFLFLRIRKQNIKLKKEIETNKDNEQYIYNLEILPMGVIIVDNNDKIQYVNKIAKNNWFFFNDAIFSDIIEKNFQKKENFQDNHIYSNSSKEYCKLSTFNTTFKNSPSRIIFIQSYSESAKYLELQNNNNTLLEKLSALEKNILEYRQYKEKFDIIFNNVNELVAIIDESGNFIEYNRNWAQQLEYSNHEIAQLKYFKFLEKSDIEVEQKLLTENYYNPQTNISEIKLITNNGRELYFDRFFKLLKYNNNDLILLTLTDINDRKNKEKERIEHQQIIWDRNKQKEEKDRMRVRLVVEKEIGRIKNMRLQQEIEHKKKELTTRTMFLSKKNDVLHQVKTHLEKLVEEGQLTSKKLIGPVINTINESLDIENDWNIFKSNLESVHPDFFINLQNLGTNNLSPNDIKHLAYMKMNTSVKEIARLFFITEKAVRMTRYRIKKKLGLDHEQSLSKFIEKL